MELQFAQCIDQSGLLCGILVHLFNDLSGNTCDHRVCRNIFNNNRACCNHGVCTNVAAFNDHCVCTDENIVLYDTGVALAGSITPANTAPAPMWQFFPTVARPPSTAPISIIVPAPITAPILIMAPIIITAPSPIST